MRRTVLVAVVLLGFFFSGASAQQPASTQTAGGLLSLLEGSGYRYTKVSASTWRILFKGKERSSVPVLVMTRDDRVVVRSVVAAKDEAADPIEVMRALLKLNGVVSGAGLLIDENNDYVAEARPPLESLDVASFKACLAAVARVADTAYGTVKAHLKNAKNPASDTATARPRTAEAGVAQAKEPSSSASEDKLATLQRLSSVLEHFTAGAEHTRGGEQKLAGPDYDAGAARQDFRAAIPELREAVRLKPDFAAARSLLGSCLILTADTEAEVQQGLAECREAVRLDPSEILFLEPIYATLVLEKDFKGVYATVQQALHLEPANFDWQVRRAQALQSLGDDDGALAQYRTALSQHPDLPEAHATFAWALKIYGDWEGTVAEYREALRLKRDLPEAHVDLARALRQNGDWDGAVAEYREALRLKDEAGVRNQLNELLRDRTLLDRQIAESRQAVAAKPADPTLHDALGRRLQSAGLWKEAAAEFRLALGSKSSPAGEIHYRTGRVLLQAKDLDGAIAELQKSVAASGTVGTEAPSWFPSAHLCMAVALARKGEQTGAQAERRLARQLHPDAYLFVDDPAPWVETAPPPPPPPPKKRPTTV